jgi:hypothetical protein
MFVTHKEKLIHNLKCSMLSYGSILMNIGFVRQLLMKISIVEFKQNITV